MFHPFFMLFSILFCQPDVTFKFFYLTPRMVATIAFHRSASLWTFMELTFMSIFRTAFWTFQFAYSPLPDSPLVMLAWNILVDIFYFDDFFESMTEPSCAMQLGTVHTTNHASNPS